MCLIVPSLRRLAIAREGQGILAVRCISCLGGSLSLATRARSIWTAELSPSTHGTYSLLGGVRTFFGAQTSWNQCWGGLGGSTTVHDQNVGLAFWCWISKGRSVYTGTPLFCECMYEEPFMEGFGKLRGSGRKGRVSSGMVFGSFPGKVCSPGCGGSILLGVFFQGVTVQTLLLLLLVLKK